MEFTLRLVVVIVVMLIAVLALASIVVNSGGQASSFIGGLSEFFRGLLGSSQIRQPDLPGWSSGAGQGGSAASAGSGSGLPTTNLGIS